MRALVTGASRGIGRATALRLARDGLDVAVHYHAHSKEAERTAAEVRSIGRASFAIAADLSEEDGPLRLAHALREHWDSLDVLVHNAGAYPRSAFDSISDADWRRCLALNLAAPAILTRELLPLLRATPVARVVFVSSVLAFSGSSHGAHYAAAKAGILGLARSLARELAPQTTVNVVAPGTIDTAILAGDSPDDRRRREQGTPLGRIGTPEEVAEAIAFLASAHAAYITGATLHVNGGVRLD